MKKLNCCNFHFWRSKMTPNVKILFGIFGLIAIFGLIHEYSTNSKTILPQTKPKLLSRLERYVKGLSTCLEMNSPPKSVVECKEIHDAIFCLDSEYEKLLKKECDYMKQWEEYENFVLKCSDRLLKTLPLEKFNNRDEEKLFIKPIDKSTTLRVMTLGIGKDISAEKSFKKSYPQTEFYGVDLDDEISGKMYQNELKGKFIRGLVGLNHGEYLASVADYKGQGGYTDHKLSHYSFKEILEQFKIKDHIDLLLMDIEGDEFPLIPDIMGRSRDYPIICQINAEFHDPKKYNATDITTTMLQITRLGKYLYLHQSHWTTFHRSFFINVMDPYCLKKFYGF